MNTNAKRLFVLFLAVILLAGCAPAGSKTQETEDVSAMATTPETTVPVETEPPATIPPDGVPTNATCKGSYTGEGGGGDVVAQIKVEVIQTVSVPQSEEETVPAEGEIPREDETVPMEDEVPDEEETASTEDGLQSEEETVPAVTEIIVEKEYNLTNSDIQPWYWTAVATYREGNHDIAPDFNKPLDTQPCPIDDSVNSWQQYFLKKALNNWHYSMALTLASEEFSYPVDERYVRMEKYWEENMVDVPAMKYLYGYATDYQVNTLHQTYLDGVADMLEGMAEEMGYGDSQNLSQKAFGCGPVFLREMVKLYNEGYMFNTTLSYYIDASDEELEAWFTQHEAEYAQEGITRDGNYVTFRQILLIPEGASVAEDGTVTADEVLWQECEQGIDRMIQREWRGSGRPWSEGVFSELANQYSADSGTAADGGAYRMVKQGQMIPEIDSWIFDASREQGDYAVIRSNYGLHLLYFSESTPAWKAESKADLLHDKQLRQIADIMAKYPMTVEYGNISLAEAEGGISLDRLLYADVAHERYPEIPVYLQQDFGETFYGGYRLRTHGCGVTAMAMLSTYMMDEEWTPVEMCKMYGRYSTEGGSDVTLFKFEPQALGFYNTLTYDKNLAYEALQQGHVILSVQTAGYWTSGGHFIIVEKLNEDGTVQVRDSNLFNYGKLEGHKADKHEWKDVTRASRAMWIVDKKLTTVEICDRCGDRQGVTENLLMGSDYLCQKCQAALIRRNAYLSLAQ